MYINRIGVIYSLRDVLEKGIEQIIDLGVQCVQLQCWETEQYTKENALRAKQLFDDAGIDISSFWAGWSGPKVWNLIDGPVTLGLVPAAYRNIRMEELCKGADFASYLGVKDMATHLGFIPENPSTQEYREVLQAVIHVANYCKTKGIYFNFETGQETPITLMRLLKDTGCDNVGINFDPANLILYGKGNPVDAVGIYGKYIRGVHVKDADYTTEYYYLGNERVVGEGSVNFPVFFSKLLKSGYDGDLYIEREISGEQQTIDILRTIKYLEVLMLTI